MLQALPPPRLPPTWGEYPPSPPVIIAVVVGGGIPFSSPVVMAVVVGGGSFVNRYWVYSI